jgi:AcrR family transcriptional regulator
MKSTKNHLARRKEIGWAKRMRTRASMLDAARRLIASRGCDAPTIDDFIKEADVARGTFYNHFKDRVEVIEAVAQQEMLQLKTEIASALSDVKDPPDRIAAIIHYCIGKSQRDPTWGGLMVHMVATGPYLGNAMHEEFAADLKAGLKSGRFRFRSLTAALDVVKGATLFAMRSMAKGLKEPELAEDLTALVLQALGVPSEEALQIGQVRPLTKTDPMRTPRARNQTR